MENRNLEMTKSSDLRWRCIILRYLYSIDITTITLALGVSKSTVARWIRLFERCGRVAPDRTRRTCSRWPPEVTHYVSKYAKSNPTFLIEELQVEMRARFPALRNTSLSTICRALRHDLKLSRKRLEKRARESRQADVLEYVAKCEKVITCADQCVFVDETSKDGRDANRRYGRSLRGSPCIVKTPFTRGKRVSVLAAMDVNGFFASHSTSGTFDRIRFHEAMKAAIIPFLNPYPLPRSIVVLDNAKIHMCPELEEAINAVGATIIYLPPYCPQFNPIEVGFSMFKRKINKDASRLFPCYPAEISSILLRTCLPNGAKDLYRKCGYGERGLLKDVFLKDLVAIIDQC